MKTEEMLFINASKTKMRFDTNKGSLPVEELWSFSLNSLDDIAIAVNKKIKDSANESFISKKTNANTELEAKLEILKFIIATKQEEAAIKANDIAKKQEISMLKELLAEKHTEGLKQLSSDEILARLAKLEA